MPWLASLDVCVACGQKHVMNRTDAQGLERHTRARANGRFPWLEAFACPGGNGWHVRMVDPRRAPSS